MKGHRPEARTTVDDRADDLQYDAFISYNHAADEPFAPVLRGLVTKLGAPLFRGRRLKIFLDKTSLPLGTSLPDEIQKALKASRKFILLASPGSAQSWYVNQLEIQYWREVLGRPGIYICLTGGEYHWDRGRNDFDWQRTNALSSDLSGTFPSEPLVVDLRKIRAMKRPRPARKEVKLPVAKIVALVRDEELEKVLGEERRRRAKVFAFIAAFLALVVLLGVFGARWMTAEEDKQASQRTATARKLLVAAEKTAPDDPLMAARLTVAATAIDTAEQGPDHEAALADRVYELRHVRHIVALGNDLQRDFSTAAVGPEGQFAYTHGDGQHIRVLGSDGNQLADLRLPTPKGETPTEAEWNGEYQELAFDAQGRWLYASQIGGSLVRWDLHDIQARPQEVTSGGGTFAVAPDGETVAWPGRFPHAPDGVVAPEELVGNGLILRLAGQDKEIESEPASPVAAVSSVRFSPSGGEVFCVLRNPTADTIAVRTWGVAQGRWRQSEASLRWMSAGQILALRDDGKVLAKIEDGKLRLYSTASGKRVGKTLPYELSGAQSPTSLVFSRDGQTVYTADEDGRITSWELNQKKSQEIFRTGESVRGLARAAGGDMLTVAGAKRAVVVDPTRDLRYTEVPGVRSAVDVALAGDGSLAVLGENELTVRPKSGAAAGKTSKDVVTWSGRGHLDFSQDDRRLLVVEGHHDQSLLTSRDARTLKSHWTVTAHQLGVDSIIGVTAVAGGQTLVSHLGGTVVVDTDGNRLGELRGSLLGTDRKGEWIAVLTTDGDAGGKSPAVIEIRRVSGRVPGRLPVRERRIETRGQVVGALMSSDASTVLVGLSLQTKPEGMEYWYGVEHWSLTTGKRVARTEMGATWPSDDAVVGPEEQVVWFRQPAISFHRQGSKEPFAQWPVPETTGTFTSVVTSAHDGRTAVVAEQNGKVAEWKLSADSWLRSVCSTIGDPGLASLRRTYEAPDLTRDPCAQTR
ncbi:TIR domain-containing protein [Streptomyces sp. SID2888]|uniref:TIR domain-containing protein n=1 Tax=Streptomyces sp. SID2888 TaxID=2690256 RepID=UPI0013698606|nr:TIR domain-containing protein [Streptomyces sp. SID2888]MYV48184.1 TIR domain-containing protein [Streptomyces sp. SID2888]